jgi:peroxin-2
MTSSNGLAYADALVHTPYRAEPCGHTYCYVCIAGKLLSDEAAEELQDNASDDQDGAAAWHCLRCARGVRSTSRDLSDVVLEEGTGKAAAAGGAAAASPSSSEEKQ